MHKPRFLSWTTAIGVVLSFVVGVVASVLSSDAGFGLLCGLISTGIALQIDTVNKLEHRERREDDVSRLLSAMDKVPWLPTEMRAISNSIVEINESDRLSPLAHVAQKRLQETSALLQGLRLGQYRVPIADMQVKFEQLESATESVLLTSIDHSDLAWWYTDEGRNYWKANLAALGRPGLRFERIFIYDQWSDDLAALVREQAAASENGNKITLWAVHREVLAPELRIDMAIWDESFTYQVELNSDGTPIHNAFSVSQADISRRLEDFRRIRSSARRIDEQGAIIRVGVPNRGAAPTLEVVDSADAEDAAPTDSDAAEA